MNDERFSYDPSDERETVRLHNARLEHESQLEQDRRAPSGSFAASQDRLARAINALTSLAERQNGRARA